MVYVFSIFCFIAKTKNLSLLQFYPFSSSINKLKLLKNTNLRFVFLQSAIKKIVALKKSNQQLIFNFCNYFIYCSGMHEFSKDSGVGFSIAILSNFLIRNWLALDFLITESVATYFNRQ
jgi:hypothetical protein